MKSQQQHDVLGLRKGESEFENSYLEWLSTKGHKTYQQYTDTICGGWTRQFKR